MFIRKINYQYLPAVVIFFILISVRVLAQGGGNSLSFQNASYLSHGDFIYLGSPDYGLTSQITVGAWVCWNTDPAAYINNHSEQEGRQADIVSMDNHSSKDNGQFWLQHSNNNQSFQWQIQNNSSTRKTLTSSTAPQANVWYYVVGVYNSADPTATMRIFVNGVEENNRNDISGNIAAYNSLQRLNIGRLPNAYRLFSGTIDEVRIWKRALSQDEIRLQMFSPETVDTTSLVSYWDFNSSSGTAITDRGSKGVYGTYFTSLVDVHDTSSAGGVYKIYDNDKIWGNNTWQNCLIKTVAGNGVDEVNYVLSNTDTSLIFQNPWVTKPKLDDLGANTGMTWYGIEKPSEISQWVRSKATIGDIAAFNKTTLPILVGTGNIYIQTTITSSPSNSNNLGVYVWGDPNIASSVAGETYPAGIDRRSDVVWGVYEWGSVTSTLVIDYADLSGISNPAAVKLLKRNRNSSTWSEVTTNVTRNNALRTFTISSVTSYGEYSIGGSSENPMPVSMDYFNASANENSVKLIWQTSFEINNKGFTIERKNNSEWDYAGYIEGKINSQSPVSYSFTEKNLTKGSYTYRLRQTDLNGEYEYFYLNCPVTVGKPNEMKLYQNYPNPSNPTSIISFKTPQDGNVTLKVYDASGREVKVLLNEFKEAGYYSAIFDGSNLSSGIYFYRFEFSNGISNYNFTRKLMLVK